MDNFDEMPVDEAIKFLDEFGGNGLDCDRCPEFTHGENECTKHGCQLVRAVSAIKREYEEKNAAYEIFMAINRNGKPKAVLNISEEQLEDIKAEMCDDYCCKRKEWTGDPDELIDTVCADCPLSKI